MIPSDLLNDLSALGRWSYISTRTSANGLALHTFGRDPEGEGTGYRRWAETEERSIDGWQYEADQLRAERDAPPVLTPTRRRRARR